MNGVSVIICCYNSAARIDKTLEYLQRQIVADEISWEVVVVDNASTDNTSSIAERKWNEHPVAELKIVAESKSGLMHARHKGLEIAQYDIVSFIDDDNWVETGWVQKVAYVFSMNEKIGACGGRSEAIFENTSPAWFPLFETSFAVGEQDSESGIIDNKKGYLWGAGLSFRRSLWCELQKKDFKNLTVGRQGKNITAGEDTELCYAFRLMDYHLYYNNDLSLKHYMPASRMNFPYLEKMNVGFGKANVRLNCYRVLLYENTFELHPWWYELFVAGKSVIKYFLISKLSQKQHSRWKAGVQSAYWRGYVSQIWKDRGSLKKNIDSLKILFKK